MQYVVYEVMFAVAVKREINVLKNRYLGLVVYRQALIFLLFITVWAGGVRRYLSINNHILQKYKMWPLIDDKCDLCIG